MSRQNTYVGITYPHFLGNKLVWWLWKKFMCKRHRHLLDEVWSVEYWYLSCDACGLEIHIDKVDDRYVK